MPPPMSSLMGASSLELLKLSGGFGPVAIILVTCSQNSRPLNGAFHERSLSTTCKLHLFTNGVQDSKYLSARITACCPSCMPS